MSDSSGKPVAVLVTGAGGYIGRIVVEELARLKAEPDGGRQIGTIVAADLREMTARDRQPGVDYEIADVRAPELAGLLERHAIDVVAHLAAIVSPGTKPDRGLEYSVDVLGTRNVLECCLRAGARKIIITSSGAAYGYHADNPEWLSETDSLRGNAELAYSDHKRQVEEMLARWRQEHPELEQLILRPGTVLGDTTANQITDLFDGRWVVGLRGTATPFVLIWDRDVARIIVRGIREQVTGIFNLAADGALPMRELATMMGKRFLPLPVTLVRIALCIMKWLGRTQYGPEQVKFLRYRPLLCNERLKAEFPYTPEKTSREVFEYFVEARRRGSQA